MNRKTAAAITGAVKMVATQSDVVDKIINDAAERAEEVADFLEEIEKAIKEKQND